MAVTQRDINNFKRLHDRYNASTDKYVNVTEAELRSARKICQDLADRGELPAEMQATAKKNGFL